MIKLRGTDDGKHIQLSQLPGIIGHKSSFSFPFTEILTPQWAKYIHGRVFFIHIATIYFLTTMLRHLWEDSASKLQFFSYLLVKKHKAIEEKLFNYVLFYVQIIDQTKAAPPRRLLSILQSFQHESIGHFVVNL